MFGLGDVVRKLRTGRGWTLVELSQTSGVDKNTISDLERGVTKPTQPTLDKIGRAFGLTVAELYAQVDTAHQGKGGQPREDAAGSLQNREGLADADDSEAQTKVPAEWSDPMLRRRDAKILIGYISAFEDDELRQLLGEAKRIDQRRASPPGSAHPAHKERVQR